jgi:hypothetical protein
VTALTAARHAMAWWRSPADWCKTGATLEPARLIHGQRQIGVSGASRGGSSTATPNVSGVLCRRTGLSRSEVVPEFI